MKIPPELLPLPPVPKGYAKWLYVGRGYGATRTVCYSVRDASGLTNSAFWIAPTKGYPSGSPALHYIIAIKARKPKVRQKSRHDVAISRPKVGFALNYPNTGTADISFGSRWPNRDRTQDKVVVVPLDKPSREALIVQAATALEKKTGKYVSLVDVRTILATLHKDFLK